jgi:phosphate transport system substrate-binding protein
MGLDVFISYAPADKLKADAACATLESRGIRCWIAPRDLLPGREYRQTLLQALASARGFLLVAASGSKLPEEQKSEIEAAVQHGIPVIPFRFAEEEPGNELGYFRDAPHWTDALTPELQERLDRLPSQVRAVLEEPEPVEKTPDIPVAAKTYEAAPVYTVPPAPRRRFVSAPVLFALGLAAILVALLVWYTWPESPRTVAAASTSAEPSPAKPEPGETNPDPPTDIKAVAKSSSEITLSWAPGKGKPIIYRIERSTTPNGGFDSLIREPGDTTEHEDAGLSPDTTYYYRLVAVGATGKSPSSAQASAKTLPLLPASTTIKSSLPLTLPSRGPEVAKGTPPVGETGSTEQASPSPTESVESIAPKEQPTPTPASPAPRAQRVLFRICGSATFCPKLVPAWAEAFLASKRATDIKRVVLEPVLPERDHIQVQGILPGDTTPSIIDVVSINSTIGIEHLGTGLCDISVSGRKIKPEEVQFFHDRNIGEMASPDSERVAGLDGIAVIVNRKNPVEKITVDQLKKIFAGETQNWSDLGGLPGKIKAVVCQPNAGSRDFFQSSVLKGAAFAPNAFVPENGTDRDVSKAVAEDPAGISFVTLAEIGENNAIKVSDGKAEALRPSPFNIHTENYPLTRRFYLYSPWEHVSEQAKQFIQFALSAEGQAIVDAQNFVGLNIKPMNTPGPEPAKQDLPTRYSRITNGGLPTGISIRFVSGSITLDNRAYQDLGRITKVMKEPEFRDKHVALVGFSDNVGDDDRNLQLSQARVKAVQAALTKEGLPVGTTLALGSAVPVASNETPEGREKNRRVEVWLTKE